MPFLKKSQLRKKKLFGLKKIKNKSDSKKYYIFQKLHFFIFFWMDFFDFFFGSEFFWDVISKQKLVLFRFMGFSGRFRHSFTLFGANFGSGCNFTSYMGRLRTKEVCGLH